ncbi:plasmid stabilization protein (plasmid) [Burkholderia gladioli pv. gladioli]|nr:plasmid stabilization protein [Burkholderia gladioli pv. gladioli]
MKRGCLSATRNYHASRRSRIGALPALSCRQKRDSRSAGGAGHRAAISIAGNDAGRWPLFPENPAWRELAIPFGDSGYVALYRYEPADDAVYVLAFRHQREAGY